MLALLAAVVVCGGLLTVTQVSNAGANPWSKRRPQLPACPPANAGGATQGGSASPTGSASNNGVSVTTQNGRQVRQYRNDENPGQQIRRGNNRNPRPTCTPTTPAGGSASPTSTSTAPPLEILATDCSNSRLQPHTGFQDANRCVSTAIGEVTELAKNATAMITDFPEEGVQVNTPFTLRISSRNLIRDRFLAAGAGGYYAETALLNAQGFARGHLHVGCRIVNNTNEAPAPVRSDFFVAVEDGGGSGNADQINVNVTGLPRAGTAVCAVWAGDGTHKTPSAQFANTQPAFDTVRFEVG